MAPASDDKSEVLHIAAWLHDCGKVTTTKSITTLSETPAPRADNRPARMMAIADIFEALTAADHPYKKRPRCSRQSLLIMATMCKNARIAPQLFGLFVRAEIYRRYAERFMRRNRSMRWMTARY